MDEFALIERFVAQFPRVPPPRGPGDDCAVLAPVGRPLCVTTDALVEGVHFVRPGFSLGDVGHKALAVNLSDLASMGASPAWAVCALGLPAGVRASEVRELGRGMAALARVHGVELVGGNVSRSPVLTVTVTVGGHLPAGRRPLVRSGARPGDLLYLSGALGDAAAALEVLARGRRAGEPSRVRARAAEHLLAAQRRPAPHLAMGLAIAPFASACIDVSDGLLQDLGHVCEASGVGAAVSSRLLPLSNALLTWTDDVPRALAHALGGGEDYVLLFTVPRRRSAALRAALGRAGFVAFRIGAVTATPGLTLDGRRVRPRGFRHFG